MASNHSSVNSKAKKKMNKNSKKNKKKAQPVDLGDIAEPGAALGSEMEILSEPEPETTVETEAERQARERTDGLQALVAVPMADWSKEQVTEWIALVDLPAADRVQVCVLDDDIDGADLVRSPSLRIERSYSLI